MNDKKPLKIVATNSFLKDLSKIDTNDDREKRQQQAVNSAISTNHYLPHWRKITHIAFNKHDTYRLARALQSTRHELSLFQAKLIISRLKWWDYSYMVDLLAMFDKKTAKKINQLLDYLSDYGKTHSQKVNTKEYEEQLEARWNEMMQKSQQREDGSIIFSNDDEDRSKYPLLQWSDEEKKIGAREVEEERQEVAETLSDWFKGNDQYRMLFVTYLDVWASCYAKHAFNANYVTVSHQIKNASQHLLNSSWTDLTKDFEPFTDWWD